MSDPVAQGVLHEVRHMKAKEGKTAAKAATNNGIAQGAASTTKGNGYWRKAKHNGERVLIDPDGHIYHGTAQEVRDAAMTPHRRGALAQDMRWARHVAAKFDYTPEQAAEYVREKRREAISRNDADAVAAYAAHVKQELGIVAEAAARYMGQTVEAFVADALEAAIRGTIDKAERDAGKPGVGLPITRHERAALDMIGRDRARRLAAWDAAQAARLAKSKARARATA